MTDGVPDEAPAAEGIVRSRRDAVLRWGLLVVVVVGFVLAVGERWTEVRGSLGEVSPVALAAAVAIATLGLLGPWRAWVAVMADLGNALPWRSSARMFFVGQLGKYVPGAVWPVLVQMRMGQRLGIPRTKVAQSFVITLALGVGTGLLVGALALPALLDGTARAYALLLLLLPLALVGLHPRVLSAVLERALRLVRRPAEVTLSGRGVLRAVAGTCFFWVVGGLHLWLLAIDLGAEPLASLPVSIGALALAVSVGPLFVVLPAGAGLREAVLVAALSTVLPLPAAVAAALVSRAVLVVGDGLLAVLSAPLVPRTGP